MKVMSHQQDTPPFFTQLEHDFWLYLAEIERYRPQVYEQISEQSERTVFLKVHDACIRNADGHPVISKAATKGAIYLIRNPLDVALSFAHHSHRPIENVVSDMGDQHNRLGHQPDRAHGQIAQPILAWSQHVLSWVDEPDLDIHVVRYEDFLSDTTGVFSEVLRIAELEETPDRIAKAVDFSQFEVVQQQERENDFRERLPGQGALFCKGERGSWREQLADILRVKLVGDHGEVMRRFGYLSEAGEPIC